MWLFLYDFIILIRIYLDKTINNQHNYRIDITLYFVICPDKFHIVIAHAQNLNISFRNL